MSIKIKCKGCDELFAIDDIAFINYDEAPIVLDFQLRGEATERKAINYVLRKHRIDKVDYKDNDGKLHMYHYAKAGKMSHEEPGDDGHNLDIPPTGYWSFE